MAIALHGIGVYDDIVIGFARLVTDAKLEAPYYVLSKTAIQEEIARFDSAVALARKELELLWAHIPEEAPTELRAFLSLHLMLLNDPLLSREPRDIIQSQRCNAEWALKQQQDALIHRFDKIDELYLRERRTDVQQVIDCIFKALTGKKAEHLTGTHDNRQNILVAHDLSPTDLIAFNGAEFAAILTDIGTATSHLAILVRSLNIPSVLALNHVRQFAQEGERLIVDSTNGVVFINPDKLILKEYKQLLHCKQQRCYVNFKNQATVTLDNIAIDLQANIEHNKDLQQAKANGASGVGLFRSEFLFLTQTTWPTEEEQFCMYQQLLQTMEGKPVTVRTIDLGRDKIPYWKNTNTGLNPAMGLTGIRLCLTEAPWFHHHLRALLRASIYGKLRLLLPMLTTVAEIRQVRFHVERAQQTLLEEGLKFDPNIPLGAMIEVPAAALTINHLLQHLDFVSIGTNDLTQYTLAVDRSDSYVAHLYDMLHPAVLRLISHCIRCANKHKVPLAICGEMAADPKITRLLLGMGLRCFSMHPSRLLAVKEVIISTRISDIIRLVNKFQRAQNSESAQALLDKLNQT